METKAEYQIQPYRAPTPDVWQMITAIATATKESHQFGVHHAEEAAIKMLTAYEHGIPLTSALSTIYVIDNKPVFAPVLMWAKILNCPAFDSYEEVRLEDKNGAFFGWELTLKRKNGHQATRRFTMDDARRAGLAHKNNWQTYPEDVCYWRVMERCAKVVFADVVAGIYGADELGAEITPEGDVIDGSWTSAPAEMAPVPQESAPQVTNAFTTVDALLSIWTPDEIMAANEGKIPATEQECLAVAEKLSEAGQ